MAEKNTNLSFGFTVLASVITAVVTSIVTLNFTNQSQSQVQNQTNQQSVSLETTDLTTLHGKINALEIEHNNSTAALNSKLKEVQVQVGNLKTKHNAFQKKLRVVEVNVNSLTGKQEAINIKQPTSNQTFPISSREFSTSKGVQHIVLTLNKLIYIDKIGITFYGVSKDGVAIRKGSSTYGKLTHGESIPLRSTTAKNCKLIVIDYSSSEEKLPKANVDLVCA